MAFLGETGLAELWSLTKGLAGKIDQHCWRRTPAITSLPYTVGDTVTVSATTSSAFYESEHYEARFYGASEKSTERKLYYSDKVEVLSDGTLSLVNPTTLTFTFSSANSTSTFNPVFGKFYKTNTTGSSIWYAAPDATCKTGSSSSSGYYMWPTKYAKVTPPEWPVWDGDTAFSSDASAYPKAGILGSYYYEYVGTPLLSAVGAMKITTGTYVGVAETTASNAGTVVVNIGTKPSMVVIHRLSSSDANGSVIMSAFKTNRGGMATPMSSGIKMTLDEVTITSTGFTVAPTNKYGLNYAGDNYAYIAFC